MKYKALAGISKTLLIGLVLAITLSGCDPGDSLVNSLGQNSGDVFQSSNGDIQLPSRPDGLLTGSDPENPYPVIDTIDPTLYATIGYSGKAKANADGEESYEEKTYYWIDQAFISQSKIKEGEEDCGKNHLKLITYTKCEDKGYPFSKIVLQSRSQSLPDTYIDENDDKEIEAYIMEENFRTQKLSLDNKSFDIVFLKNKTQSDKLADPGKGFIFDIFISADKTADLEKPDVARGKITASDPQGNEVTAPLSLRQILEDCGQKSTVAVAPTMFGEVRAGDGENTGPSSTSGTVSDIMPQSITLAGTSAAIPSEFSKATWTFGGELDQTRPAQHGSFVNSIDLGANINDLKKAIGANKKMQFVSAKLIDNGLSSYLAVEVVLDGKQKKYLYRPSGSGAATILSNPSGDSGSANRLGWVSIVQDPVSKIKDDPWCGFTPESKPAIYLYPQTKQRISVKVSPQNGWMTVSDPYYADGWNVEATPDGFINYNNKTYRHLFYEAMLPTPKMSDNFDVIDGNNLKNELQSLGKKLSLSDRESKEMADYWSAKLPERNLYQVGLMTGAEVDKIEPMRVSPAPDSVWRLRLIFKGLDKKTTAYNPLPQLDFNRNGFSLVEWGGFVLN